MVSTLMRAAILVAALTTLSLGGSYACDASCQATCKKAGGLVKTPPAPFLPHCEMYVKVQGTWRRYDIYFPANYDDSKPVVTWIHIHGAFSTKMSVTTQELWDKQKYVVQASEAIAYWEGIVTGKIASDAIHIYPLSSNTPLKRQIWNAEFWQCSVGFCSKAPDRLFLELMVANLRTKFKLGKIFASGNSNGGMMIYTMICKSGTWAKEISGYVIQNSGIGIKFLQNECKPKRHVPIMQVHGGLDPVISLRPNVTVDGVWFAPQHTGSKLLAKANLCRVKPRRVWKSYLNCDPQYCTSFGPYKNKTRSHCNEYCARDPKKAHPTTALCIIAGGGHALEQPFPGFVPNFSWGWMKHIMQNKFTT